jgi:hypothetical protein
MHRACLLEEGYDYRASADLIVLLIYAHIPAFGLGEFALALLVHIQISGI